MGQSDRRVVLVTGGASGIGNAAAAILRDGGAEVIVIDRETDVTNRAALEQAFERAGTPDVVIANAGIGNYNTFAQSRLFYHQHGARCKR